MLLRIPSPCHTNYSHVWDSSIPGISGPLSFCRLSFFVCGHFGNASLNVLRHAVSGSVAGLGAGLFPGRVVAGMLSETVGSVYRLESGVGGGGLQSQTESFVQQSFLRLAALILSRISKYYD